MDLLDKKIEEARQTLFERFEWQCSQSAKSAKFMYENNTMYGYIPEEGVESALKHGTTVIGQLGLAEALNVLIGKDQTSSLQLTSLDKNEIAERMVKKLEELEKRSLSVEEKEQVARFAEENLG